MSDNRRGIAVLAAGPLLLRLLDAAQADSAVRGIVVTAFDADVPAEDMLAAMDLIENGNKPVVAALSGSVVGPTFELALACHSRVAQESTRIGLTGITLGLIPSSGGTQRLPRLTGVDAALAFMLDGKLQGARSVAGLFDTVVGGDAVDAAAERAHMLVAEEAALPRARDRVLDPVRVSTGVDARRKALTSRQKLQPAYAAVLDAVAGSALPFDEGMRKERELFETLTQGVEARALHYLAHAERAAITLPAAWQAPARTVRSVAIIGAGTMGSGIAISALDAGLSVLLLEQDHAALARGEQRIADHYSERVEGGKLRPEAASASEARLSTTTDWDLLGEADLVIEAVFEDLAIKQQVFRQIDAHARPGAVLATNTSYLDVDAIAAATARPGDVVGLHFFSPANIMKLLEVVRGAATAPDVLATGMAVGNALKKLPVVTGNAFGFIGNRIYNAYRRQCEFMLEDGAWPEDVDSALTSFGFAMGPFAVADLSGLDIAWRMRKAQAPQRDPRERYVAILDHLCEMGRLGRKSGAGYYAYVDGKQTRTTDNSVRDVITQASADRGIQRRSLEPEEIRRRALLAMANEAALLLAEGVAARPSDVDVVMVQGYGFPRWQGGPVFWAGQLTPSQLDVGLAELARAAGPTFQAGDTDRLQVAA